MANEDYKVADINLADFGRKEISLAETEMPGLMALRSEYKGKKLPKWGMVRRSKQNIKEVLKEVLDPKTFDFGPLIDSLTASMENDGLKTKNWTINKSKNFLDILKATQIEKNNNVSKKLLLKS